METIPMILQQQKVLITGGSGALGRGVTPLILASGATVTVPYIVEAEADLLFKQLDPQGQERLTCVPCDLLDETSVAQMIQDMGRVDAVIHLVGGFAWCRIDEMAYADWQKQFDLNLHTAFLVCKYALKVMRQQGYGRIVTVGTRAATQPGGHLGAYAAAKAGVLALTGAIADENKGLDVTANSVLPAVIDTPQNRKDMGDQDAHRWVKPESLGQVILFLASPAARDLRGAQIPVYGNF